MNWIVKLAVLFTALSLTAPTFGQSACQQLGVDCSHPQPAQRPNGNGVGGQSSGGSTAQERREYKNFYKSVDLADKANSSMEKDNLAKALKLVDEALALRSESGYVKYQDHWAYCEGLRGDILKRMGHYLEAVNVYNTAVLEDVSPKNQDEYGNWLRTNRENARSSIDEIFVPTPVAAIPGAWRPAKIQMIGGNDVTITSSDGSVWHAGDFSNINFKDARIQTGLGTKVKLSLPDGTTFSLSPASDIKMDDFVYDPSTSVLKGAIQQIKGTFRFISEKLDDHSMTIRNTCGSPEMNAALQFCSYIGIRGTEIEVTVDEAGTVGYLLSGAAVFVGKDGKEWPLHLRSVFYAKDGVLIHY